MGKIGKDTAESDPRPFFLNVIERKPFINWQYRRVANVWKLFMNMGMKFQ